jgi:Spx/MgsR family transcriptional regulator
MKLKVFGLNKCSTCQKAIAWFDDNNINHHFTDVKESPLNAAQVAKWSAAVGGWEKMINRAGYTWRGLPPADTTNLTEKKAIALALRNPSLIRRPLIEHADGSVTVGFSEKVRSQLKP